GETIGRLGAVGVVLLLFFVGLEVSPQSLASNWRVSLMGTILQVALTTALVFAFGWVLGWPLGRSILLGFVISLSSTAVVLKLLKDWEELDTKVGQDVLGVLLTQDMMIIPMLIALGLFMGDQPNVWQIVLQLAGAAGLIGLVVWITVRGEVHLPFRAVIRGDPEFQVLAALLICFGLALFSGLLNLSTALGAFVAGMVIQATREVEWAEDSLESFRVVFIALFFASVGMLVDLNFILQHWWQLLVLVLIVVVANTAINAWVMRLLGRSWRDSFYAGALLSQIGEFSFVLAAVGWQAGAINDFGYQMTIAIIAISLLVSPAWIALAKRVLYGGVRQVII
ncbi:MAG: cation:proton antiporter, partial [Rhodospirillales bacterium]|nr:cation:proton antiporter [Rhodospirillales bacterium]